MNRFKNDLWWMMMGGGTMVFYFKNGPIRHLFVHIPMQVTNIQFELYKWRSIDWVLGTRTRGGRMEDADESTELWRHPMAEQQLTFVDAFVSHEMTLSEQKIYISTVYWKLVQSKLTFNKHRNCLRIFSKINAESCLECHLLFLPQ